MYLRLYVAPDVDARMSEGGDDSVSFRALLLQGETAPPYLIYFHHAHIDDELFVCFRFIHSDLSETLGRLTPEDAALLSGVYPEQSTWLTKLLDWDEEKDHNSRMSAEERALQRYRVN